MVGLVGKLAVYDGPLTSKNAAFLRPSDPGSSMEELRKRYHEDGYLFLKHLLSREDVLEARKQYFEFMASTGVLKESTAPVEGVFNPERSPEDFPGLGSGTHGKGDKADEFINSAVEAHYQKWYTEVFCQSPILYDFIAKFTGWGQHTLALKRSLLRNNIPNTTPIGVHYDQIFLRYGDPTSVTAWVPIGDISIQGGGLMYLEDGHTLGMKIEDNFTRMAREGGLSEEDAKSAYNSNMMSNGLLTMNVAKFAHDHGRRWLVTAYEAGDVVLHKPHAIHASTINKDPHNIIRLGTDLRFCDSSKPFDHRWANYFVPGDGA